MILVSTSVGKKLLVTYLNSLCFAWKSVSQMRFNTSSHDDLHHGLLDCQSLKCQICSLPEMRGSCAVEREAKEHSTARTGHGDKEEETRK